MAASFLATVAVVAASVPAVYVFGDSLADVGNNNHLLTLLKADFSHNGMDYPGGKATGRFSNGKNSADFLGAYSFHSKRCHSSLTCSLSSLICRAFAFAC
jgi:phospholipase/lecithinase/hemolysin